MCERKKEKEDGENWQLLQCTYVPKTMKIFYSFHTDLFALDTYYKLRFEKLFESTLAL